MRISDWSSDVCSSDLQQHQDCGRDDQVTLLNCNVTGGLEHHGIATGKNGQQRQQDQSTKESDGHVGSVAGMGAATIGPCNSGCDWTFCPIAELASSCDCYASAARTVITLVMFRSEEHTSELQLL